MTPTKVTKIGDLYAEIFEPTKATGVVIITHGYAEHCGRYREVANVCVKAGWLAVSYDVRGHGQSPGKRGAIERFETYLDDLDAVIAHGRTLGPSLPVVLLGHSNGSLITLRALCGDRPPAVKAAIVSSPFLGLRLPVPGYKKLLARVASRIAPDFAQPNELRVDQLTHDKGKQAERTADKLCFDIATSRWFTESMKAQDQVARHADRISVPTTWLVGADDPIADPARSRYVANRVRNSTYHDLKGMKHEVFNEVDRARVFDELTKALVASA